MAVPVQYELVKTLDLWKRKPDTALFLTDYWCHAHSGISEPTVWATSYVINETGLMRWDWSVGF